MKHFCNLPFKQKLLWLTLASSAAALMLGLLGFIAADLFQFRRAMPRDLRILARIIADNGRATLAFNDPKFARDTLLGSLAAHPRITHAILYDAKGRVFAEYARADRTDQLQPSVQATGHSFEGGHLNLFEPIQDGKELVGTVYLQSDLKDLNQRLWTYGYVALGVMVLALSGSLIVGLWLMRLLARPLEALTQTARAVVAKNNYSLRAHKFANDELGSLTEIFNEMLAEIQERDFALQSARETLKYSVKERTQELASSLSLLNATLEASVDGIIGLDRGGNITNYNRKFVELWSYSAEVMVRRDPEELLALALAQVKNADILEARFNAVLESPETETLVVLEFHDGRIVERLTKPQYIGDQCVGAVVTYRDITARKRSEQELRWKTALLEAQVNSSIDGILVVDPGGKKIVQNQRVADLFKIPSVIAEGNDDAAQVRWVTDMIKDSKQFVEKVLFLYAHPDEISRDEIELKDGTVLDRYSAPVRDTAGNHYGRIWTFRDITEHKRTEQALRESAERMRLQTAALESAANGVAITDPQGKIEWINPAFTQLTGYSAAEVFGRNASILKSGQQPESYYKEMWQTISKGCVWKGEIINRRKDGQLYHEEMIITPVRNADGATTHFVAVKQDITERKRADEALRESQALYHSLVEQLPTGVFRKDVEGRYVFANSWFYRIKGMSSEQILGKTPLELLLDPIRVPGAVKPGDWEKRLALQGVDHHELIMRTGTHIEVEDEYPGADGRVRHLQVVKTPVFGAGGKIIGTQGVMFDISERKQAADVLRRTEEVYRSAISGAGAVPYSYDFKSRSYVFMGEGIQQLIGYSSHEVNGELWKKIIQKSVMLGEAVGVEKDQAAQRVQTGDLRNWRCDMLVTTHDGKSRWISDASVQNLDESGRATGSVGILQDITERKEAEAELERVHRELLDASRAAGMAEVATSVLHNVGNVLNSVNTSASVVADRLKDSKGDGISRVADLLEQNLGNLAQFLSTDGRGHQVVNYLKTLARHHAAERASALSELQELTQNIEHIKEIVVMQQSYARVSGVTETVKPTDLVEDALRMNGGALVRHGVELIREYDAHLPEITVEKHKVLQILVNLIRNAKYACDDSHQAEKRLRVRLINGNGCVRIAVVDNGIGIPPENLTRIFSHGFTTRKDGHGFGLHSGALAAKELGGSLHAHSDGPGRGATFTLELPIHPA